jgi:hypothetical protein
MIGLCYFWHKLLIFHVDHSEDWLAPIVSTVLFEAFDVLEPGMLGHLSRADPFLLEAEDLGDEIFGLNRDFGPVIVDHRYCAAFGRLDDFLHDLGVEREIA